jgi:hypothetical protein
MSLLVARKHHIVTPACRKAADEARWVIGCVGVAGSKIEMEARQRA